MSVETVTILNLLRVNQRGKKTVIKNEILIQLKHLSQDFRNQKPHNRCNAPNSEMIALCKLYFDYSCILNKASLQKDLPKCTTSKGKQHRETSNGKAHSDR